MTRLSSQNPGIDSDNDGETPARRSSQPTDYFCTGGYKKMALCLLKRVLTDACGDDAALRDEALEWIGYEPALGQVKPKGLDFELIVELADLPVQLGAFRRLCLDSPAEAARVINDISDRRIAAEREAERAAQDKSNRSALRRWLSGETVRELSAVARFASGAGAPKSRPTAGAA